jgi:hypothetical protein
MRHNPLWWTKRVSTCHIWQYVETPKDLNLSRNVAEQLIEKGLASVVRHKRDDEDRSSDYDKLMAAEQTSVLHIRAGNLAFVLTP